MVPLKVTSHDVDGTVPFQLYVDEGKEKFVQACIDSQPKVDGEVLEKVNRKAQYFRDIPVHLVVLMPEDPRQRRWDEDYGAVF